MKACASRYLHRCARALGWSVGVLVIALAVAVASVQLFLPLLVHYPRWVATQLSARLHRPLSFVALEGHWQASGPLLVMHDVTMGVVTGKGGSPLHIPRVLLKLDFGAWLLPSRHFFNLRVSGLRMDIAHEADGGWHVKGIGVLGNASRQGDYFGQLGLGLWLDNVQVDITDSGRHYTVMVDALRLDKKGHSIRVGALVQRKDATGVLRGAGRFRDDGSSGQLWLSVRGARLHTLLDHISVKGYAVAGDYGDVSAWLDWRQGKLVHSLARIDLDKVAVKGPQGRQAKVASVHATADIRHVAGTYLLRWVDAHTGAMVLRWNHPGTAQSSLTLAVDHLSLAPLLPWLAFAPKLPPLLAAWWGKGRPHGLLQWAFLRWNQRGGLHVLQAEFSHFGIDAKGTFPALDHLRGHLRGDAKALALELPAQNIVLGLPKIFRRPLAMTRLDGNLVFWRQPGRWYIGTPGLNVKGQGFAASLRGRIQRPVAGGTPSFNLYVHASHADVTAVKQFLPVNAMPARLVNWLDRALVSGQLDQCDALLRGDLKDWPFLHHKGRFEASAQISKLVFDYARHWPQATGIEARLAFVNNGMRAHANNGQSLGVRMDSLAASIKNFGDAALDLRIKGSGKASDFFNFMVKSPVARDHADTLSKLQLGGLGSFGLHLWLPLRHDDKRAFRLTGQAELKKVDVYAPDWSLKLDGLTGPASFSGLGFHAGPLRGRAHGEPSTLDLAVKDATGERSVLLAARLRGRYSIAELLQNYPALHWLGKVTTGKSDFRVALSIRKALSNRASPIKMLSVDSPLTGIAFDLPAPLRKRFSDRHFPLHLSLNLPLAGSTMQLAIGSVFRGRFRLADGPGRPLAGVLRFGKQAPVAGSLPVRGWRIDGQIHRLNASAWMKYAMAARQANSTSYGLRSVKLGIRHALLFGHDFSNVRVQARHKSDTLDIRVKSKAIAGRVVVPSVQERKRGITVHLKHLYWPKENFSVAVRDEGSGAHHTPATTLSMAETGVNPASLPPLHVMVSDLRLGQIRFGQARLETWPTSNGMHIDQLQALSPSVQVSANGGWNGTATDSYTHLRIDMAANNLGETLSLLGFRKILSGGKAYNELDASWPGAPTSLKLANMKGKLDVKISNGHILALTPGVGRLFGLVSLVELPRRLLSLDFGDVLGKGLGFDVITGDFILGNGHAVTHNLKLRSPVADIDIKGRVGLRDHDYDQQVTVVPHVSGTLPVVGALVGGPVGMVTGMALQGLIGKGFNRTTMRRYHIGGSWSKPVITLVKPREAKPPAVLLPSATPGKRWPALLSGEYWPIPRQTRIRR